MRYLIFVIIEILLIAASASISIEKITPWLLGANFTIAIFSINFTFFGHQLSRYKPIYSKISKRQWINICALLIVPFAPLMCFLIAPDFFSLVALLALPILSLSAIDNAELTSKYLNPTLHIEKRISEKEISKYLHALSNKINSELESQDKYLSDKIRFELPTHATEFEPGALGIDTEDLWDSITVVTKLSIENHDYPVFRCAVSAMLRLATASYAFRLEGNIENYKLNSGLSIITRKRLRSIINGIVDLDNNGLFLQSLSSELCNFLERDDIITAPCSDLARAVCSDAIWVGKKMLESNSLIEPIRILNTIHRMAELSTYRLASANDGKVETTMERYSISAYAYDIKTLGVAALNFENPHFAYRCLETLSYLGCNAAKVKSKQIIIATLESIVQIGRIARSLKIGCFWSRCLIPAESHAEEFIGHILTWLVQDITKEGDFFMREYTEQAYSRLRGVKCLIQPKLEYNPCLWIEELKENGEKVAHIEYQSGMYGYGGQLDYSDFTNLKDYVLHGIGSRSNARIVYSSPIPFSPSTEE